MFKKLLHLLVYLIDRYQQRKNLKKEKLIKTYNINGKLKSDVGEIEALQIHLTKPFIIYELITNNNKLYCADEHIVFLENGEEIWVKDLKIGMFIKSNKGLDEVLKINKIGNNSYMYDISVDKPNRYYTNNILSHNTICSSIFMLWYITFEIDKNIMIVANKGDTVNEIVNKVKDIYKYLPFFIKPGISILNEKSIRVDTDCRILGAARSKEPAIGFTIDVLYMDEFAHIPKNIIEPYYENALPTVSSLTHSKVIITSTPNGQNLFYNLITDAETTDVTKKNEYTPMRVYWHQVPGRDTILIIPNMEILKTKKIELTELKEFLENEGFIFIKEQKINKGIRLHYKHHKYNYDDIIEISKLRFRDEFITEYCIVSSLKNSEINTFGGGQKGLEKFGQQYDLLFNVGSKMLFGGHIMSSLNSTCRPFEYIDIPEITDNVVFEIKELKLITCKKDQENYFNIDNAKDYYIVISIDLAEGLGKDYLVANIFRLLPININDLGKNNIFSNIDEFFSLYQIGIYYNNLISVEEFAEFIYLLVFEFFDSEKVKIVVESNGYGDEFIKSMQYAQGGVNNFGSHVFVKYKHSHNANILKPGIRLNNINRAMLIKTFQGLVERHKIKIFEKSTIEELATFTKQESRAGNVKYEAEIGHDDITMSMVNLSSIFDTTELKNMCEIYYDDLDIEYKEMINSRLKNVYVETIDYELSSMKNKKIITDEKLSKMEEQFNLLDIVKKRKTEYSDDDDGVSSKDILYGSGFDNRL